jgi:hypothetical protein
LQIEVHRPPAARGIPDAVHTWSPGEIVGEANPPCGCIGQCRGDRVQDAAEPVEQDFVVDLRRIVVGRVRIGRGSQVHIGVDAKGEEGARRAHDPSIV